MRATVPKKLKPRQRVAIAHPCLDGKGAEHPRFHRRNGKWQTILTIDLFPEELAAKEDATSRAVWHARATTWPKTPMWMWAGEIDDVKLQLKRLLIDVGQGDVEIGKSADDPPTSVHFYKYATDAEVERAARVTEVSDVREV